MAIQFDIKKMDMFRNANLANEDTIANLDAPKSGIKANGQYTGKFSAIGRPDDVQRANNEVRTALLKSLGQAFGLAGMSEEHGVVKFSRAFMDRLTQILGNEVLKRDDFKVGADGIVKSGRPLTKRRIDAIMTKATMVGKTNFDLGVYRMKMDEIFKDLGLAGLKGNALESKLAGNKGLRMFVLANQSLSFLENQLFLKHEIDDPKNPGTKKTVYGPKNDPIDRSFIRVSQDYLDFAECGISTKDLSMFQVRDPDGGLYREYTGTDRDAQMKKMLPGQVIHMELAGFRGKTPEDMEKLKKYIYTTEQFVVQKMVDLYFECKVSGKLDAFMNHLANNPGACMEDKGKHLAEFEARTFKVEDPQNAPLSKAEIAELERIAAVELGDPIDKQIYAVIDELYKVDPSFMQKDDWSKDFADIVKSKLYGKNAQLVNIEFDESRNQYKFTPVTDKSGNPVVRKLTEKDIDEIGKACLHNVNE